MNQERKVESLLVVSNCKDVDYYPGGMLMPGRIYPTPQNEHLQPASGAGTAASPITVYQHAFSTTASGSTTYSVAPDVINGNFSSSSWTSSAGNFTSYPGATGNALSLSSASAATTTYTLVFNVSADKTFTATSFSLWRMSSGTGYRNWSLTINNIFVGSDTITTTGTTTGTVNVSNPVSNLTGTVTVVLALSGGSHGGSGTFRLDNFTLNGFLQLLPGTATGTNTNDTAKYPYTINGQMRSDEIAVNTTTALFGEYDSRIVRRWNVDPRPDVSVSPYVMYSNNPIMFSDVALDTPRNAGNGILGQQFSFSVENNTLINQLGQLQNQFLNTLTNTVNNGGYTYNGNPVSINTSDPLASTINVVFGTSKVSSANMAANSIYVNINEMAGDNALSTHEWLHTAGLMDRYYELYGRAQFNDADKSEVDGQRSGVVPMGILPPGHDNQHRQTNIMSGGGTQVTPMQWNIVFNLQNTGVSEESLGTLGKVSFIYNYSWAPNAPHMAASSRASLTNLSNRLMQNTNSIAFSSTNAFYLNRGALLRVPNANGNEISPTNLNNFIIHNRSGNVMGASLLLGEQVDIDALKAIKR